MKITNIAACVFLALVTSAGILLAQDEDNTVIQKVASPNGRYTAVVDGYDNVIITDNNNGKVYPPVETSSISAVRWTGDSQSLVIIGHMAGGTSAGVVRRDGKKWFAFGADPEIGIHYQVVRTVIHYHTVEFSYVTIDPWDSKLYLCSFVFHPDTLLETNKSTKAISLETFIRLKSRWNRENN